MAEHIEEVAAARLLPLAGRLARHFCRTHPHTSEAEASSDACLGLLVALRKYRPECGALLETVARRRIRWQMVEGHLWRCRRGSWGHGPAEPAAAARVARPCQLSQLAGGMRDAAGMARHGGPGHAESRDDPWWADILARPDHDSRRLELAEEVERLLGGLSEYHRLVVRLVYLYDCRQRRVAELLGRTPRRSAACSTRPWSVSGRLEGVRHRGQGTGDRGQGAEHGRNDHATRAVEEGRFNPPPG